MNSWSQNPIPNNNNIMFNQTQFNPYTYQKLPIYHAEPIHGANAAWQFPMGPNSDIWLPDVDEDVIWWIRTDMNGNKSVMDFDINPRKKKEQVDMDDILARLGAVEEWINGKQNKSNAKRNTTNNAPATTTTAVVE